MKQNSNISAAFQARGIFNLKVYRNGELIEDYTDNNLVVTLGKRNIARLLGGDAAGLSITKIAAGTNSTSPALTDSTITDAFVKDVSSVAYPSANTVEFNWTLASSEANGLNISEFGLQNSAGVLFARKTRTPIVKTSDIVIVGIWKIIVN